MDAAEVSKVLKLIVKASREGNLRGNSALFGEIQFANAYANAECMLGGSEFKSAALATGLALSMLSFRTPLARCDIAGVETLALKALDDIARAETGQVLLEAA